MFERNFFLACLYSTNLWSCGNADIQNLPHPAPYDKKQCYGSFTHQIHTVTTHLCELKKREDGAIELANEWIKAALARMFALSCNDKAADFNADFLSLSISFYDLVWAKCIFAEGNDELLIFNLTKNWESEFQDRSNFDPEKLFLDFLEIIFEEVKLQIKNSDDKKRFENLHKKIFGAVKNLEFNSDEAIFAILEFLNKIRSNISVIIGSRYSGKDQDSLLLYFALTQYFLICKKCVLDNNLPTSRSLPERFKRMCVTLVTAAVGASENKDATFNKFSEVLENSKTPSKVVELANSNLSEFVSDYSRGKRSSSSGSSNGTDEIGSSLSSSSQ